MNQKKTIDHNSKKRKKTPPNQGGKDGAGERKELHKICIFSKHDLIQQQFLKATNACVMFSRGAKMTTGVDFVVSTYIPSPNKNYVFQWWIISNKPRFEPMMPSYLLGASGIIYFYHLKDTIEEKQLSLIKSNMNPRIPLICVGYEAVLPAHPEESDPNIPIIRKHFPAFLSSYVSVEQPNWADRILEQLIAHLPVKNN